MNTANPLVSADIDGRPAGAMAGIVGAPHDAAPGTGKGSHRRQVAWWIWPAILAAYTLLNVLLVSPTGNFPLNDDWVYSESVFHLLKTGQFHLLCSSAACYLHVGMGAVACLLFGANQFVLRSLTVALGLVAVVALYCTLRRLGVSGGNATLLSLVLAANPLFVHLSFTFMTDISALALGGLYILLMLTGLKAKSARQIGLACVALCCAVLIRQTWAILAACNLVLVVMPGAMNRRLRAVCVACGVVAPIAVAIAAERLFAIDNAAGGPYMWQRQQMLTTVEQLALCNPTAWGLALERLAGIFAYMGLFCLPVIPAVLGQLVLDGRRRARVVVASLLLSSLLAVGAAVFTICVQHRLMPFSDNLLRFPMVGPINLMGVTVDGIHGKQRLWLTIVSSLLSVPILAVAFQSVMKAAQDAIGAVLRASQTIEQRSADGVFCGSVLGFCVAWLVVYTAVADFDRYYLMALPALILCIAIYVQGDAPGRLGNESRAVGAMPMIGCARAAHVAAPAVWASFCALVLVVALGAYSTLAAQDYMNWNRARFQAIGDLEHLGVSPSLIDGGPEYNYMVNPELVNATSLGTTYSITHRGAFPRCNWRWWSISGEKYIISFSPVPSYDVIGRYPFFGALSMSSRDVLVLKQSRLGAQQR